ncbi:MAG: ABC transporter permease [Phycisphaerales bacterium]|nr:ABC transporter permease [Phycisphaerales bacterium]
MNIKVMQTKAIFIDAYRELNAKKLFWLTMGLNLLAVLIYASLGINERGFSVLFWTFDGEFNTNLMTKTTFYKLEFLLWGVPIWLSWCATILALISTAGIIPDLVSGGTIEPVLSKPIGRIRLFLTKYLTGLFFVGAQILVFSIGCFLVLRIRAGVTEFGLFLAIPIVLAFFSYLFAVCSLVGLVTKSTITALLLTILFWVFVFILNVGENVMLTNRETAAVRLIDAPGKIESQERFATKRIEQLREEGKAIPGQDGVPLPDGAADSLEAINPTLQLARSKMVDAERAFETWSTWESRVYAIKLIMPKTSETLSLLSRNLINEDELGGLLDMMNGINEENDPNAPDRRVAERVQEVMDKRSIGWILGTSFGFEFVVLGLATLIFVRRDF